MDYWSKKEELTIQAHEHTQIMLEKFSKEIADCINNTKVYSNPVTMLAGTATARFKVFESDVVAAIEKLGDREGVTVLNFADYNNPGGKFMSGSCAQEESLCHASTLYNILQGHSEYYEWNRNHKNKGLYTNRALYTKNVLFFTGNAVRTVDMITCAAPNRSIGLRYGSFTDEMNEAALMSRIEFLRHICQDNNVTLLIAGAWGCGVFKQDPNIVAHMFKEVFSNTSIPYVVFPMHAGKNLETFKRVFDEN